MPYPQPTQSDTLHILVAGHSPSAQEAARWYRVLRGNGRVFLIIAAVLTALFGLDCLGTAAEQDPLEVGLLFLFLGLCTVLMIVGIVKYERRQQTRFISRWGDEVADADTARQGFTLAFYDDRVVRTTKRGSATIYFSGPLFWVETPDGFAIQAGRQVILLRACELTAFDAALIREFLQKRIPSRVYRMKGHAAATLQQPLPIPRLYNADTVISRMTLPTAHLTRRHEAKTRRQMARMTVPALCILGASFFTLVPAVSGYLWNVAIGSAVFAAGGILLQRLLIRMTRRQKPTAPLSMVMTNDGLVLWIENFTVFFPANRLKIAKIKSGIAVTFSSGDTLKIPWTAMDQPETVRELIDRR